MREELKPFATHLEFLGYEVTEKDDAAKAVHEKHFNFHIKLFRGGILLTMNFGGVPDEVTQEFLEYVNSLNDDAAMCRYCLDSDADLRIECVFPAAYEKKSFGSFMEALFSDEEKLRKHESTEVFLN